MSVSSYREQRQKIPPAEMAQHTGKWVAFSCDGARVVASSEDLETLEKKILAAGEDPENVVFEFAGAEEMMLGGAEFL